MTVFVVKEFIELIGYHINVSTKINWLVKQEKMQTRQI